MTSPLQADVFVSPAIPAILTPNGGPEKNVWSPISSALIQGATSAVLVDTAITVDQNNALADWIEKTAPGKVLRYIYTTHQHGDHFFGAPTLLKRFPQARFVATENVAKACITSVSDEGMKMWHSFFPDQIASRQIAPEALPVSNEFTIDGHLLRGVEVEHSDCKASSFLHVPSLNLVVGGDIVYGDCYQHLGEANTREKRNAWKDALDQIAALKPEIVVPGHKRATQVDGSYLIEATKKYISVFEEELAKARTPEELETAMKQHYPERWNEFILGASCKSAFAGKH